MCHRGIFASLQKLDGWEGEVRARADLSRASEEGEKLKDFENVPVLTEPEPSSAYRLRLYVFVLYPW